MSKHGQVRHCVCGCGLPAKKMIYAGRFKSWCSYASGHAPNEKVQLRIPTSAVALSYAAGIIDGEGCIYARIRLKSGRPLTYLKLQVLMCSEVVISWLHEEFGGSVFISQPPSARHKVRFQWSLSGGRVGELLRALLPYLREKHMRALAAIELSEMLLRSRPGRKAALTKAEIERRTDLVSLIKRYNRRPRGEDLVQ